MKDCQESHGRVLSEWDVFKEEYVVDNDNMTLYQLHRSICGIFRRCGDGEIYRLFDWLLARPCDT